MSPLNAIQVPAPAAAPATTQPATPAGADPNAQGAPGLSMLMPLVLMFVVFYFLLLRPQRKQQKERERMIANLKKNDHVITHSGIYGIVKQVQDSDLVLCIDENKDVRVRVARSGIAGVVKTAGGDGSAAEAKAEASEKK